MRTQRLPPLRPPPRVRCRRKRPFCYSGALRRAKELGSQATEEPEQSTTYAACSVLQLVGRIDIQAAEAPPETEGQRQSHGDLSRGHRQNEEEHHLSVCLTPVIAGHDERQPGRIEHNLDRGKDEDDVPPDKHTGQPQNKKDEGKNETMLHRDGCHHSSPPSWGMS